MCLAIPGQIVEIQSDDFQFATVDIGGVRRGIHIGMLAGDDRVQPGDWVLVHVGFAIGRLDEAEAAATLQLLAGLGDAYDEEL